MGKAGTHGVRGLLHEGGEEVVAIAGDRAASCQALHQVGLALHGQQPFQLCLGQCSPLPLTRHHLCCACRNPTIRHQHLHTALSTRRCNRQTDRQTDRQTAHTQTDRQSPSIKSHGKYGPAKLVTWHQASTGSQRKITYQSGICSAIGFHTPTVKAQTYYVTNPLFPCPRQANFMSPPTVGTRTAWLPTARVHLTGSDKGLPVE